MTTFAPDPEALATPAPDPEALAALAPDPEALAALARKYRTLSELHRALAAWDDARARALEPALAREFPGALRELQTMPLEHLEQRAAALDASLSGAPIEPWMPRMIDYHRLLRTALALKPRLPRPIDDATAAALAAEATRAARLPLDTTFVRACARPPRGRLHLAVLDHLAARYDEPPATLARTLYPFAPVRP